MAATVAALAFGASEASAASFSINFCPGDATCPAGVTEASLTFDEDLGTIDNNDYILTASIQGGPAGWRIDEINFKIDSAQTPSGYEAKPSLTSAPGGVAAWDIFYDNVSGNSNSCVGDTGGANAVCAQSITPAENGPLVGNNVWVFSVDLANGIAPLGVGSSVNLRAQFVEFQAKGGKNTGGEWKNAGILSPGGTGLVTGTTTTTTTTTGSGTTSNIPEPASLLMVGAGLALAIRRFRR
jgi:hypothetical protein